MNISPLLESLMAPFGEFLSDPTLVEIMAVKPGELVFEKIDGGFVYHQDKRFTLAYWKAILTTLANEQDLYFSPPEQGLLAVRLPDRKANCYHRCEAMWGDRVLNGISVCIRLKRHPKRTLQDFCVGAPQAQVLKKAIAKGVSLLVSGGTSSGKTSLLNVLIQEIPLDKRVITIEDTPELTLLHENWVSYRIPRYASARDMAYQALIDHVVRMRPDIIITGEISVDNCFPLLRLLNTGHQGFMATIHANSPQEALDYAFQQNLILSGVESFQSGPYLRSVIDTVIQVDKCEKGQRRVTEIWKPSGSSSP